MFDEVDFRGAGFLGIMGVLTAVFLILYFVSGVVG